ncbi:MULTISPECIES: ABC transporter substrate-binding protein [Paenarthrobacter]|uniref:ABC transporter substrate-binding protein n=2 Tax=Micrococcaceae TaxID=1268 RepID=A0AAX3EG76_PAEUR|nr:MULTISPECIES: ABC transporter substrate-binding protein [Paenarthrobacter]NKR14138.1 ABC transporter substrate-binding protein [Arthrobacter sp. M5]NKR17878.1 ABC transporter substrate-binding protein [Arthrobacter sp. M6]OEH56835.1 ABC transporter substrate-binding protein [Arthrobacter sp. D4]OEH63907.1 ABC transporter substrate-binding protein [Arthrobacter sp. D2]MDO5866203.1 ABC transporter substrate-binding protein [Paenarthrobacter sp. SD-2]
MDLNRPAFPLQSQNNAATPRNRKAMAATAIAAALLLSACGGGAAPQGAEQAAAADPASGANASGAVNICGVKDASGIYKGTAEAFTKANGKVTAKYTEIGATTDEARTQIVQRLEGKSTECDLFLTDVIWTSEFASQGWLLDQTKLVEANKDRLIPSTVETTKYQDKYWASPFFTNAGLIYYQKDKVAKPESWQQLYAEAAKAPGNGYVYQGKQYEGLTVNFLEMLYSAGGEVLNDQGDVKIDSQETRDVLNFMSDGLKNGSADRAVLTYNEDPARLAYESGDFGYQRNWPHVYRLLNATPLASSFGVAPLPAWEGGKASGVLGGWNLAISAHSTNQSGAVAFIDFATTPDWQKHVAMDYSQAPVNEAAYSDPAVLQKMPFATELLASVKGAKPRPISPVYPQISQAIYKNVYAVLSGTASTEDAVKKMADEITTAKASF